jgi:hypothetical protein
MEIGADERGGSLMLSGFVSVSVTDQSENSGVSELWNQTGKREWGRGPFYTHSQN